MASLKTVAEKANVSVYTAYQALNNSAEIDATVRSAVSKAADTLNYNFNITLRDVAAYAGVSTTTVSYVLNNNPLVKPATRELVLRAIKDLNYHPNTNARNLKSNEARMIGYAWHVMEDPIRRNAILDRFLYDMAQAAESYGYHVLTFTQPAQLGVKPYDELISTNRVDGFILTDTTFNDRRIKHLMDKKVPFAAWGHSNPDWNYPYVDVDGRRGMELAVEHLVLRGHKRIAFLGWPDGTVVGDARKNGYYSAMRAAGIEPPPDWIGYTPNIVEYAYRAAQQVLSANPRPTAVVCVNDVMALGVRSYLESVNLQIGEDVAVIGYDDTPIADLLGLTSIRQPVNEVAARVIDLLMAEIQGGTITKRQIVLEPSLIVRMSSRGRRSA
ncbi:MAG: LacI family DNA-binding transcriptional regulator [Chloroflexi bacterium]|nr:LacI family DNA-binding transcriptional regulator [Chloroflexota bacterium]